MPNRPTRIKLLVQYFRAVLFACSWVSTAVTMCSWVPKYHYRNFFGAGNAWVCKPTLTIPRYNGHFGSFSKNLWYGYVWYNEPSL